MISKKIVTKLRSPAIILLEHRWLWWIIQKSRQAAGGSIEENEQIQINPSNSATNPDSRISQSFTIIHNVAAGRVKTISVEGILCDSLIKHHVMNSGLKNKRSRKILLWVKERGFTSLSEWTTPRNSNWHHPHTILPSNQVDFTLLLFEV